MTPQDQPANGADPQVEDDTARADAVNGEDPTSATGDGEHRTGEAAAARNREEDPPA